MKKYITVYCGSKSGKNDYYTQATIRLAEEMHSRNFHLVFGAGKVGLMGVIADKLLDLGQDATGVIPQHLVDMEVAHKGLTELIITNTMHERKTIMADKGSAFIAMPGGFGTLEEITEVLTWAQLSLHTKPMALYNINGYYDHLVEYMNHMVVEGFLSYKHYSSLIVESNPTKLIERIDEIIMSQNI